MRAGGLLFLFLLLPFCPSVWSAETSFSVSELVVQLNAGACVAQFQGGVSERRSFLASFSRRHDKYWCIADAARELGRMGVSAQAAVPELIKALQKYRNIDTGDGLIALRSHVALALGEIEDVSAVAPLVAVLLSEDKTQVLDSFSVSAISSREGTSYAAVVFALEMFGPQAREAVPVLVELMDREGGPFNELLRREMESALAAINR